ncbi:MAG: hypothetical protein SynsKO_07580 [Synoicihabitans sp.]
MTALTRSPARPAFATTLIMLGLMSGALTGLLSAQSDPDPGGWERGLSAQGPGDRGMGGPPPGGHPLLALFDTDKDGVISATEINAAAAALHTIDANKDGVLSEDEMVAAVPPPRGQRMGGKGKRGMGPTPGNDF